MSARLSRKSSGSPAAGPPGRVRPMARTSTRNRRAYRVDRSRINSVICPVRCWWARRLVNAMMSRRLNAAGLLPWSSRPIRRLVDSPPIALITVFAVDAACRPRCLGRSSSSHRLLISRSQGWLMSMKLRFPVSPNTVRSQTSLPRSVSGEPGSGAPSWSTFAPAGPRRAGSA